MWNYKSGNTISGAGKSRNTLRKGMKIVRRQARNKTERNGTNNIFNNETCQKAIINRWHFPYWVAKVKFNNNTTSTTAKSKLLLGWRYVALGLGIEGWGRDTGTSTRRQHVNNENWHADINTRTCCGPGLQRRRFPSHAYARRLLWRPLSSGMYSKNVNMLFGLVRPVMSRSSTTESYLSFRERWNLPVTDKQH